MTTRYVWASLLTAGIILYGSLSPFDWYHGASTNPLAFVISRWDTPYQSWTGLLANIALYLPLGFFISLARAPGNGHGARLIWAGLWSLLLCFSVELIQVYDWDRQATLTDVYPNVAGALLGAELAWRLPHRLQRPIGDLRQPLVLGLLVAFFVIELYPFIPTLNTAWYDDALASLWRHPHIHARAFIQALIHWVLAGVLLMRLFGAGDGMRGWAATTVAVFAGQIVMLNIWLSISEWVAVLVAGATLVAGSRLATRTRAGLVAALLIVGQTCLMATDPQLHSPTGLVFADLLHGDVIGSARRVISLFYIVGGLWWCLYQAGLSIRHTTLAATGLMAGAGVVCLVSGQGYASTTPAGLALLIGLAVTLIGPRAIQAESAEGMGAKRSSAR